jgi:predicted DNA-binding protein YlxM (UPF0122 family)
MRIENYEIEPYEYGYMVSEILVAKTGDNIGQEYKTDTKYPRDLQRALEMVRDNIQRKSIKDSLQATIDEFNEIDKRFIETLKSVL